MGYEVRGGGGGVGGGWGGGGDGFFLEAVSSGSCCSGYGGWGAGGFAATMLVAAGTMFSAFWILSAESGADARRLCGQRRGQLVPDDWWKVVFNRRSRTGSSHGDGRYLKHSLRGRRRWAWHLLARPRMRRTG